MADSIYTFHKTVQGYRHIQEEIPCQDNSISFNAPDKDYQIIAIGDGHGDPACHRSHKGSELVVKIAEKCLKEFADAMLSGNMDFSYPRRQCECMKQLTDTIISKWCDAVRDDLAKCKITDKDLEEAGSYKDKYQRGEKLTHLYGTTFIAALKVDKYLVLMQQGDGRCDVFYGDGSVDQPIPWDERCEGSTTTSMCDEDASNRIRTKVIDLDQKNIVACYIGSDGVEDSYYNNEETQLGTHRFYMDLTYKLNECGIQQFDSYLNDMLPEFSKAGSTDDVSVAGIVDLEMISRYAEEYKRQIEQYDYTENLSKRLESTQAKIISMTRKHSILHDQIGEIRSELDKEKQVSQSYENELQRLIRDRDLLLQEVNKKEIELEKYQQKLKSKRKSDIPRDLYIKRKECDKCKKCQKDYEIQIKNIGDMQNACAVRIREKEKKLAEAQSAFDEYDIIYKSTEEEKNRIKNEIAALSEGTQE